MTDQKILDLGGNESSEPPSNQTLSLSVATKASDSIITTSSNGQDAVEASTHLQGANNSSENEPFNEKTSYHVITQKNTLPSSLLVTPPSGTTPRVQRRPPPMPPPKSTLSENSHPPPPPVSSPPPSLTNSSSGSDPQIKTLLRLKNKRDKTSKKCKEKKGVSFDSSLRGRKTWTYVHKKGYRSSPTSFRIGIARSQTQTLLQPSPKNECSLQREKILPPVILQIDSASTSALTECSDSEVSQTQSSLTENVSINKSVSRILHDFKLRIDNMTFEASRTEIHVLASANDVKRENLNQKELLHLITRLMEENESLNQQVAILQKEINEQIYAHAIETDITALAETMQSKINECVTELKNKIFEAEVKAKNDISASVLPDETLKQHIATLQTVAYHVEDSLYLDKMIRLQNERLTNFCETLKEHKGYQEKLLQEFHELEQSYVKNQVLEKEMKERLGTFAQPFQQLKAALLSDDIETVSDSKLQQVLNNIQDQNKKMRRLLKNICKNDDNIKTEIRVRGEIVDIVSYEEYEVDTKDIKFDFHEDKENPIPTIKAATISKLIERLTSSKYSDVNFREAFLLTYQSFMTSTELLQKLIERYCMTPVDKNVSAEVLESLKQKQGPIRARVLHVIRRWIEKYYQDFSNQEFERYLLDFLQNTVAKTGLERQAESLIALYLKRKSGENKAIDIKTVVKKPPYPILPPKMQFSGMIDLSPIEMARQITLLEQQLFKAIKPHELQNQCWTKPDRYEKAPNVMKMINHATRISMWVVTEILKHETVVKRAECCKKFIDLALECHKISNFNAVMEIVAGLGNAAISRLKHTWKEVDRQKFAELERLRRYFEQNYRDLRVAVHSAPQPVIPFLGVYLTDLTYVEDGAADRDGHLINFQKLSKIAEYILEIQQYQQGAYNFVPISILQTYVLKMKLLTDDEAFDLSFKYEPRLDKNLMSL
jgi:hypothetical protein